MIYIPVKESSVFTQTTNNKKVIIVNEASKDRATVNEVRSWFKVSSKLQNLMIVPVGENKGKHGGALLVIMLNKFTMQDDGNQTFDHFNVSTVPACNKIFQMTLINTLQYVAFKKRLYDEVLIENLVFKTMDAIMSQGTMYEYCKATEIYFAELFNCERVNVVLVHRVKKYLFRIEQDETPGTYKFVKFDLQRGLAGYAAISTHSIMTESV